MHEQVEDPVVDLPSASEQRGLDPAGRARLVIGLGEEAIQIVDGDGQTDGELSLLRPALLLSVGRVASMPSAA